MAITQVEDLKRWVRISCDDGREPVLVPSTKVGSLVGFGKDFIICLKGTERYIFLNELGEIYQILYASKIGEIIDVSESGFTTLRGKKTREYDSDGNLIVRDEPIQKSQKTRASYVPKPEIKSSNISNTAKIDDVESLSPPPVIGSLAGGLLVFLGVGFSVASYWLPAFDFISCLFEIGLFVAVFSCMLKGPKMPALSIIGLILVIGFNIFALIGNLEGDDDTVLEVSDIPMLIAIVLIVYLPLCVSWMSSFQGRMRHAGVVLLVSALFGVVFEYVIDAFGGAGSMFQGPSYRARAMIYSLAGAFCAYVAYYSAIVSVLSGSDSYETVKSLFNSK